jgi:hypothetical protein
MERKQMHFFQRHQIEKKIWAEFWSICTTYLLQTEYKLQINQFKASGANPTTAIYNASAVKIYNASAVKIYNASWGQSYDFLIYSYNASVEVG